MNKLYEHLEKAREKLQNPSNHINKTIVEYLADVHVALEKLTDNYTKLDDKLDEKAAYLEERIKHFLESNMNDFYGLANAMEEHKEGLVELESSLNRWKNTVNELAEMNKVELKSGAMEEKK